MALTAKNSTETPLTKAQLELAARFRIAPDAPVLPNMTSWCKVDFIVNERAEAMVLFDQPMPELVDWIEFDADVRMVTFVTYTGKIFSLGAELSRAFCNNLMKGLEVQLIQVRPEGNDAAVPVMMDQVPLVVRHIGI